MKNAELDISGKVYTDESTRERFSRDASSYRIVPKLVAEPANEDDVLKVLEFARKTGETVTCRAGGSGLSGAGVTPGIILNLKSLMNRIKKLDEEVVVEPGVVLEDFLARIKDRGWMLPAVPSSSAWCALGGNVATRSTGPRTARYGTIDSFLSSLRFITAGGEVVDTRESLPVFLEHGLMKIRERYLADAASRELFERRPFIAGGYNIRALAEYEDPRDIVTHLMAGSIGTLGIVIEIRLDLIPFRPSQGTYAAFFRSIDELGAAVNGIKRLNPSAIEFADASTMSKIRGELLAADPDVVGVIMVEFDESREQAEQGRKIMESFDLWKLVPIPVGSPTESKLWEERRRILPSLWAHAKGQGWIVPSIIDDVAIHVSDFAAVYKDLQRLMADLGHEMAVFGHVGFGSIHARPYFEPRKGNIVEQIMDVTTQAFRVIQNHGGTLVGEHNAGRSRSVYLERELRELGASFQYLRDVKALFDPDDVLNRNTIFDLGAITDNMDFAA
jgi:glycolate oxidase